MILVLTETCHTSVSCSFSLSYPPHTHIYARTHTHNGKPPPKHIPHPVLWFYHVGDSGWETVTMCIVKKFFKEVLRSITKPRPLKSFRLSLGCRSDWTFWFSSFYLHLSSFPLSLEMVCYYKHSTWTCSPFEWACFPKLSLSASRFLSWWRFFSWTSYKVCFCLDWVCPIFPLDVALF